MTTEPIHSNESLRTLDEIESFLGGAVEASDAADAGLLQVACRQCLALVKMVRAAEQDATLLDEQQQNDLQGLIQRGVVAIRGAFESSRDVEPDLRPFTDEVHHRWGEVIAAVAPNSLTPDDDQQDHHDFENDPFDGWDEPAPPAETCATADADEATQDLADAAQVDLDHVLGELRRSAAEYHENPDDSNSETCSPSTRNAAAGTPSTTSQPTVYPPGFDFGSETSASIDPLQPGRILDDPDMAEAYLDDAVNCVASMEQSLLAYEADTNNRAALNQVCRELHTLKGASASVELNDLAAFLHEVEDQVRAGCDPDAPPPDPNRILESIDKVREQIEAIGGDTSSTDGASGGSSTEPASAEHASGSTSATTPATSGEGDSPQATLRVKAAQVDRLMDMLAELVMLRNRRDSRVERIKQVQHELQGCASRVRSFDTGSQHSPSLRSNSLIEVADDVTAAAEQLRGVAEPLDAENRAISQFIRQFRQELIDIRRVPAAGLFRRLQRAVRDAAQVEQKQVRFEMQGEQTGVDRSLQERLYDPLLHIVRNAVSHGVESAADRSAAGKPEEGVVTIEARGSASFLVVEVRDDGRGLDYDALRRKGLQRNLLQHDRPASKAELAQLIFHPGFSTRQEASGVAGRGVGMDVVASAIEQLRGWIDIDSTPGKGARLRITVPLQSTIEHAMLFRNGGATFAVPMRFVHSVLSEEETAKPGFRQDDVVAFSALFGGSDSETAEQPATLVLGFGAADNELGGERRPANAAAQLALQVDEIVGPEEIVMRPLPNLLKHHRLYSGLSLAGSGATVLALDPQQLLERVADHRQMLAEQAQAIADAQDNASPHDAIHANGESNNGRTKEALVVDDSSTARRAMVKMLKERGFEVREAEDGVAGAEAAREQTFDLIVSDLEMPRKNGLEMIGELSEDQSVGDPVIILSSSRTEEAFQQQAAELGAVAYLVKPVDEPQLDAVLNQYAFQNHNGGN